MVLNSLVYFRVFSFQLCSFVNYVYILRICILGEWLCFVCLELFFVLGVGLVFMYIFFVFEVKYVLLIECLLFFDWLILKVNQKYFLCLYIFFVCF